MLDGPDRSWIRDPTRKAVEQTVSKNTFDKFFRREGDKKFVAVYFPAIQQMARIILAKMGRSGDDLNYLVDEVTQNTWIEIEKKAEAFRRGRWQRNWDYSFRCLLFTITLRQCWKQVKSEGRYEKVPSLDEVKQLATEDPELKQIWDRAQVDMMMATIRRLRTRFKPNERLCFELYYWKSNTVPEIADKLHLSENTVRKYIKKTRKEVKKIFTGGMR